MTNATACTPFSTCANLDRFVMCTHHTTINCDKWMASDMAWMASDMATELLDRFEVSREGEASYAFDVT